MNYVPKVRKLFDNSASIPLVPSKHVDVLEDAATYFVMLMKSDDRAMVYGNLVQGKLMAMLQQHRGTLVRAGENFGRIIPRRDLLRQARKPQLYYPTPTASSTDTEQVSTLVQASLNYTSFTTAATSRTVTARTLPANRTLFSVIANITTAFSGGSISDVQIEIGIQTDTDKFISNFSAAALTQESAVTIYFPGVATAITVTATSTGANLSDLTQGAMTLYFQENLVS